MLYIHQDEEPTLLASNCSELVSFSLVRGEPILYFPLPPPVRGRFHPREASFFEVQTHTFSQPITYKLSFNPHQSEDFFNKKLIGYFLSCLSISFHSNFSLTIHFQTGLRYGQFLNVVYVQKYEYKLSLFLFRYILFSIEPLYHCAYFTDWEYAALRAFFNTTVTFR